MKILIDEEVVKWALDVLLDVRDFRPHDRCNKAITALRSALQADTKVEPTVECVTSNEPYCWMLDTAEPIGTTPVSFTYQPKWGFTFPLYAAQTPSVPMEEVREMVEKLRTQGIKHPQQIADWRSEAADMIERLAGVK